VYIVSTMLFGRQKAIEVHCWGGLGSQLFALALIHDLKLRFPSRESTLVLHSSGVTKRAPEITILPFVTNFIVVDDYSPTGKSEGFSTRTRFIRLLLRRVTAGSGLISNANTDIEFRKIRPWVRQIRGHYSRRTISTPFLINLESFLKNRLDGAAPPSMGITIHYRLGDLLYLAEKAPVNENRLAAEVLRVQKGYPGKISLFSDSPQVASGLLLKHGIDCDITNSNLETIDVINSARISRYFVGTSSKISYWVICLRNLGGNPISASMPSSDLPNLSPLIGMDASNRINYY
jgi:hypothetical protein